MTPEQFTYWLQGYTEVDGSVPSEEQWNMIKDHLAIVFNKVTPTVVYPPPNDPEGGTGTPDFYQTIC